MFTVCFFSSQNNTDWCTYSLQRRRANTSTNTIDRRTHYHKVQNTEVKQEWKTCFQSANLNLSHLKETPSDTDPKKKKKKRDDDPDRKKKKKDKKKKKVRQAINNWSVVFLTAKLSSIQSYEVICDL